jgi:hypothetical protein
MALVPTITPAEVEAIGALTYKLFLVADQAALDVLVQSAIDYADAWFQGHSGSNYGITSPAWVPVLQRRGVMYLALEALCDTLKAEKIYGTHFPYMSEDSPAYEALIDNEWGQRAKEALDLWITVETGGAGAAGFALPYFGITDPVPLIEDQTNGLESLKVLYEQLLAHARGRVNPVIGTAFS